MVKKALPAGRAFFCSGFQICVQQGGQILKRTADPRRPDKTQGIKKIGGVPGTFGVPDPPGVDIAKDTALGTGQVLQAPVDPIAVRTAQRDQGNAAMGKPAAHGGDQTPVSMLKRSRIPGEQRPVRFAQMQKQGFRGQGRSPGIKGRGCLCQSQVFQTAVVDPVPQGKVLLQLLVLGNIF